MSPATTQHSLSRSLIRFLGSMNLAITLLVAIAIAAVIGTVLQQNQPYPDYLLKFGPFWFEIFKALDLYDVYSSTWFLTILTFLVISTSVCIYRNTPRMLQDMQDYREHSRRQSLQHQPHHAQWSVSKTPQTCADFASALLKRQGYRYKIADAEQGVLIAAKKGTGSRLGYIFTHLAIVIICLGGLLDGNVPLKWAELRGAVAVETRRIPASEVPAISTLDADNLSFRANIDIPEGKRTDLAFIDFKDGYLVQKLPFIIKVEDFRIEHYASGQPKSFESDLVVFDKDSKAPVKATISVNHPFSYKGYAIYQNSFGDGGSRLNLRLQPLLGDDVGEQSIQATVKEPYEIATRVGALTLEIADFRPFNVSPDPKGVKKFRNMGPSFQFKLRKATGEANEYINYMQPVEQDGARYYVSGMRSSPAAAFQYWFIPADAEDRTERFMKFLALLRNTEKLKQIALASAQSTINGQQAKPDEQNSVAQFMVAIGQQFLAGGTDSIALQIERAIPADKRQEVTELYATLLKQFLRNVYLEVLQQEGIAIKQPISPFDLRFFDDAVTAISVAFHYGSPVYIELDSFKHIEATGLQITKSPGQMLVFPGCLLLVVGVFLMFYMPQRRLWLLIEAEVEKTSLLLAGSALRNRYDFDKEFDGVKQQLSRL